MLLFITDKPRPLFFSKLWWSKALESVVYVDKFSEKNKLKWRFYISCLVELHRKKYHPMKNHTKNIIQIFDLISQIYLFSILH